MIVFRQKDFAKLSKAGKAARNAANGVLQVGNNLLPKAKRASKMDLAKKAVAAGRKTDAAQTATTEAVKDLGRTVKKVGVTAYKQPAKLVARGAEEIASRPLRAISMPLLVLPEPITTAVGADGTAVSKWLMKNPRISEISGKIRKGIKGTGAYEWATSPASRAISPEAAVNMIKFRMKAA